ncbi:hypothetical protein BU17DRAFT_59869 [Hysterangium stoloniferum]|nr:hypothetical protein BU17DRAFT_59869 [Hysterangium stoloniferum]
MHRFQQSLARSIFREIDPLSVNPNLPLTRVSRSSNDPEVKNAARNEMIRLLAAAGAKGMDSERLNRKVTLAAASLGCRGFGNTVFMQMIKDGPFDIVASPFSTARVVLGPNVIYTGYLYAPGLVKMEPGEDLKHSYVSALEQPTPVHNLYKSESTADSYCSLFTASEPDAAVCFAVGCPKPDFGVNPALSNDAEIMSTFTEQVEMPATPLDILELDRLLDSLVYTLGAASNSMGGAYPIGQLISDIAKGGVFTAKEAAFAISTGPFHVSVSYIPAEDKGSPKRRSEYERFVNSSL